MFCKNTNLCLRKATDGHKFSFFGILLHFKVYLSSGMDTEETSGLCGEISSFLTDNGISNTICTCCHGLAIRVQGFPSVIPVTITAESEDIATAVRMDTESMIMAESSPAPVGTCQRPIIIASDRWIREGDCIRRRLLAHYGRFSHIFARNCHVEKITRGTAAAFMDSWHSYGDATCKYRYGLFLDKAFQDQFHSFPEGTMIAAATFSNGRFMERDGKLWRSYQWIRYASFPDTRVSGGMGKIMKHFMRSCGFGEDIPLEIVSKAVSESSGDRFGGWDIMSYADLEWSGGGAYASLGFRDEGLKAPVMYRIDPSTWSRTPVFRTKDGPVPTGGYLYFENFGSTRFRIEVPYVSAEYGNGRQESMTGNTQA